MKWFTGIFFWGAVVLIAGTANFVVKHTVQRLDDELGSARRKTVAGQKQIHDLTAEWTYLNQPELLSDLNRRYVGLAPVASQQFRRNVDDIPLRPVAPPAAAEPPSEPQIVAATMPFVATPAAPPATPAQWPALAPANPIVPVVATSVARVTPVPTRAPQVNPVVLVTATGTARVSPPPLPASPPAAPSLDALFAQVAGGR